MRKIKSRELSRMKSCSMEGLSQSREEAEMERAFRVAVRRGTGLEGPGLSWMSPDRSKRKKISA